MPEQQAGPTPSEKTIEEPKHLEMVTTQASNLVYDQDEEEPELHARTYFAVAAMFLLNMVQVLALQGPPTVVCKPPCGPNIHHMVYLLDIAFNHRRGSPQPSCTDLGTQCTFTCSGCRWSHHLLYLRLIPGPKNSLSRPCNSLLYWGRYCTRFD